MRRRAARRRSGCPSARGPAPPPPGAAAGRCAGPCPGSPSSRRARAGCSTPRGTMPRSQPAERWPGRRRRRRRAGDRRGPRATASGPATHRNHTGRKSAAGWPARSAYGPVTRRNSRSAAIADAQGSNPPGRLRREQPAVRSSRRHRSWRAPAALVRERPLRGWGVGPHALRPSGRCAPGRRPRPGLGAGPPTRRRSRHVRRRFRSAIPGISTRRLPVAEWQILEADRHLLALVVDGAELPAARVRRCEAR